MTVRLFVGRVGVGSIGGRGDYFMLKELLGNRPHLPPTPVPSLSCRLLLPRLQFKLIQSFSFLKLSGAEIGRRKWEVLAAFLATFST